MVKIEVHVRSGCTCQVFFTVFFLGVSIDALDRISSRVGYIITTVVIALVFVRGLFFRHCFLLF